MTGKLFLSYTLRNTIYVSIVKSEMLLGISRVHYVQIDSMATWIHDQLKCHHIQVPFSLQFDSNFGISWHYVLDLPAQCHAMPFNATTQHRVPDHTYERICTLQVVLIN